MALYLFNDPNSSLTVLINHVQYLIYGPFVAKAIHANLMGGHDTDNWCLHMVFAAALRMLHGQLWMSASRVHYWTQKHQIQMKGVDFKQVDREEHW